MKIIRMHHCRRLSYCSRGVRTFFKRYELDYAKFLREGIPADEFLKITNNDAMVQALAEIADVD